MSFRVIQVDDQVLKKLRKLDKDFVEEWELIQKIIKWFYRKQELALELSKECNESNYEKLKEIIHELQMVLRKDYRLVRKFAKRVEKRDKPIVELINGILGDRSQYEQVVEELYQAFLKYEEFARIVFRYTKREREIVALISSDVLNQKITIKVLLHFILEELSEIRGEKIDQLSDMPNNPVLEMMSYVKTLMESEAKEKKNEIIARDKIIDVYKTRFVGFHWVAPRRCQNNFKEIFRILSEGLKSLNLRSFQIFGKASIGVREDSKFRTGASYGSDSNVRQVSAFNLDIQEQIQEIQKGNKLRSPQWMRKKLLSSRKTLKFYENQVDPESRKAMIQKHIREFEKEVGSLRNKTDDSAKFETDWLLEEISKLKRELDEELDEDEVKRLNEAIPRYREEIRFHSETKGKERRKYYYHYEFENNIGIKRRNHCIIISPKFPYNERTILEDDWGGVMIKSRVGKKWLIGLMVRDTYSEELEIRLCKHFAIPLYDYNGNVIWPRV